MFGLFMRHSAWPLAIMLSADPVPVKSTRSSGAMARVGCPDLWADWRGCVIRSIALSNLSGGNDVPVVWFQAACGSGVLYASLRTIMAQAIRAILLASATAATLVGLSAMILASQGSAVPRRLA